MKDGVIIFVSGGGVFSMFHQFLENLLRIDYENYKQYRMYITSTYVQNNYIFDNVFHYEDVSGFTTLNTSFMTQNSFLQINEYNRLSELKKISSTFKFQDFILDKVNTFVNENYINKNTLGVHLRLTDMNIYHPSYGVITIDNYISKIKEYLESNKEIKNIFLASDNEESINIIKEKIPNYPIIWNSDSYRVKNIVDDNFQFQVDNLNNPDFYQKNVIEALILSKCGILIHRISDFANFSILFSESFKDIICLK